MGLGRWCKNGFVTVSCLWEAIFYGLSYIRWRGFVKAYRRISGSKGLEVQSLPVRPFSPCGEAFAQDAMVAQTAVKGAQQSVEISR